MIGYGWGNVCYIVFFFPGKYLLYNTVSVGKLTIQQMFRGGMFTTPGEGLLCGRFTIRHRHLYVYGVCTKSGKLLVQGPLWFLYLHCWTVVCVVCLLVCFLILLEIYLKVKQKVTSNLKATHLESHTAIQEVRVWARSELAPLLSDFQMWVVKQCLHPPSLFPTFYWQTFW